jgi:hypothetical protein
VVFAFNAIVSPRHICVVPEILTDGLFLTEIAVVQFALQPFWSVTLKVIAPETVSAVVKVVFVEPFPHKYP